MIQTFPTLRLQECKNAVVERVFGNLVYHIVRNLFFYIKKYGYEKFYCQVLNQYHTLDHSAGDYFCPTNTCSRIQE